MGFDLLLLAPVGSILALGFAFYLALSILKMDEGTDKMKEIAQAVRVGARAYLKRQYLGVSMFFVIWLATFPKDGLILMTVGRDSQAKYFILNVAKL